MAVQHDGVNASAPRSRVADTIWMGAGENTGAEEKPRPWHLPLERPEFLPSSLFRVTRGAAFMISATDSRETQKTILAGTNRPWGGRASPTRGARTRPASVVHTWGEKPAPESPPDQVSNILRVLQLEARATGQ